MHNAALLGSSLLSLQSFTIAEYDTGHHDHMPPLAVSGFTSFVTDRLASTAFSLNQRSLCVVI
jgi:hypothetical protein